MIPVLSAKQVRQADEASIKIQGISSGQLMEKAGEMCAAYMLQRILKKSNILVFCGTGNNGGDGLVIARLLAKAGYQVEVFYTQTGSSVSADFKLNFDRLEKSGIVPLKLNDVSSLPVIKSGSVVVDALLGTGISGSLTGFTKELVVHMNKCAQHIISIDLPSGLMADASCVEHAGAIVHAKLTLCIGAPKTCLFMPENAKFIGDWVLLDIGLDKPFMHSLNPQIFAVEKCDTNEMIPPRSVFSHKGSFGHALLVAGSKGKNGAAVLAAKACLRSGAGLTTVQVPSSAYSILQAVVPEAMCLVDEQENYLSTVSDLKAFSCIGIGPGIGTHSQTAQLLRKIMDENKPMVIDADALNILSENKAWLNHLPKNSVLTPHPKEFERLFGTSKNNFERFELLKASAEKYSVTIVLKGHYSIVASPGGTCYINTTGNAGMATGGSGDVLTGIITGLLAQGIDAVKATVAGVYIHGLSGDLALETQSMESLKAGDITEYLGKAFKAIRTV